MSSSLERVSAVTCVPFSHPVWRGAGREQRLELANKEHACGSDEAIVDRRRKLQFGGSCGGGARSPGCPAGTPSTLH